MLVMNLKTEFFTHPQFLKNTKIKPYRNWIITGEERLPAAHCSSAL
jgi:hypothetical protein